MCQQENHACDCCEALHRPLSLAPILLLITIKPSQLDVCVQPSLHAEAACFNGNG